MDQSDDFSSLTDDFSDSGGKMVGTVAYASPEQQRGIRVTSKVRS